MSFVKSIQALALIAVLSVSYGFIFSKSICLFYNITGVPCPACGMTRAWIYFLKGDVSSALHFHPVFFIVLFVPLLFLKKNNVSVFSTKQINYISLILLFILILTWSVRLILLFPDIEPMNFNYNALLPKLYNYIIE